MVMLSQQFVALFEMQRNDARRRLHYHKYKGRIHTSDSMVLKMPLLSPANMPRGLTTVPRNWASHEHCSGEEVALAVRASRKGHGAASSSWRVLSLPRPSLPSSSSSSGR